MIVIQSGSPPFRTESTEADARPFMSVFRQLQDYIAPVPSYPMGMIALRGASLAGDSLSPCIETIRARVEKQAITTRYYEPGTHRAAFELLRGGRDMVTVGQQASF
jgi:spermidine synthase